MHRQTELRKLPAASLTNVANILEINNDWQKIVTLIPKNLASDQFERKYNSEDIRLMGQHAKDTKQKYAEVLFDEWGTSGRVRPTLDTLMKILQQAQIFRAVDEIARMIGEPPPPRPDNGPGAPITTNLSEILNNESVEDSLNSRYKSSQDLCNRTTRQLPRTKELSDMIEFSLSSISSEAIPNMRALQSTGQKQEVSDYMKFSKSESLLQNVPKLSVLLNNVPYNSSDSTRTQSDNTENSVSIATGTSTQNELSLFTPNISKYSGFSRSNLDIFGMIDRDILDDRKLVPFEYRELEQLTNKFSEIFCELPNGPVGKIGSGGFGDVYVGTHKTHGALAVKRVKPFYHLSCELDIAMKIFNTEVKSLSHLRHENIVPIFGYSIDGPTPCIVCKYIDNGSLQQKIAAKVLTEQQRMYIIRGTAEGLKHIHHTEKPQSLEYSAIDSLSSKKSYYLHGDVKSANILLTKDCIPKLCDFGLVKQLDTTLITRSLMGTLAYMAPEGLSGTITQKIDIFSFGIVLLEIITGLSPIVTVGGDNINIKNYVKDMCLDGNISKLVDRVVPKWTKAQRIYELATRCLEWEKNERPTIDEVYNVLNDIDKK